jgi:hypothetical protein
MFDRIKLSIRLIGMQSLKELLGWWQVAGHLLVAAASKPKPPRNHGHSVETDGQRFQELGVGGRTAVRITMLAYVHVEFHTLDTYFLLTQVGDYVLSMQVTMEDI